MAGTITHAYFADDLYQKFDYNIQNNLIEYKENLKTYSQGHDIFFFTTNIHNYKTKKIGNYMHRHNTKDFFKNMILYIKNNNLENNYEIISFLYGNIYHYCLDSTVHPYIIYKAGIFNKKKKETYKYNSKHNEIESYIDAYFINKNEHIEPNKYKLKFNTKVSKELKKMVDEVYKKTYNFNHMSLYLKQGLFNMKISYGILKYDPHKIKKKLYTKLDKITKENSKKFAHNSYAYELNNNDYYLNLKHKTWNHPRYKDEKHDESFVDLYNEALEKALVIIKGVNDFLYNNKDEKILDKLFLNLSYYSGKDCNDKAKNKYFEF